MTRCHKSLRGGLVVAVIKYRLERSVKTIDANGKIRVTFTSEEMRDNPKRCWQEIVTSGMENGPLTLEEMKGAIEDWEKEYGKKSTTVS